MLSTLFYSFRPTLDAIFSRLPFSYRWRLLCLQPLSLLTNIITTIPYVFSAPFKVHYIPTRTPNRSVRAIIFHQPRLSDNKLRPVHLDVHGGSFLGGLAEFDAPFCKLLAEKSGAVVVSTQYRCAPVHTFPAAHEDVEDVARWLRENARDELGADPELLTVSGFSAGANLVLGASQTEALCPPATTAVKASVSFYAPVDLRLPPQQKPKPASLPKFDPVAFFLLFLADSYANRENRAENAASPILHPILAPIEKLPRNMYFVVAGIDILLHEQLTFVERLKNEIEAEGEERRLQMKVYDKGFHGWLELPVGVIDEKYRKDAFDTAVSFIRTTHENYGFVWKG